MAANSMTTPKPVSPVERADSAREVIARADPTTIGDARADALRHWYEQNREAWWERWRKPWRYSADNFMLDMIAEVHRIEEEIR